MIIWQAIKDIQKRSLDYLKDNEEAVAARNQRTLRVLSLLYLVVICLYCLIVPVFFADWGVDLLYRIALLVHIPVFFFIMTRYGKTVRNIKEVNHACTFYQIYNMAFVIMVSILPLEMEQPAVYFAPILLGFSVCFVYTWLYSVFLAILEIFFLSFFSYLYKPLNIFYINLYSSLLLCVIVFYMLNILYTNRYNESEARKQLLKANMYDKLTQIYSRAATEEAVRKYIDTHPNGGYALVLIDSDNFKTINDSYGHTCGDYVLMDVAKILSEAAGNFNVVGRIGGDEFLIFVKHCNERKVVDDICHQILRNANKVKIPADDKYLVSCSIGVCEVKKGEQGDYENMFTRADEALYTIKKTTKNGLAYYGE